MSGSRGRRHAFTPSGRRGQEGVAALETALVLPLVMLLLVALLGVVGLLSAQLSLEQAARAGARAVAVTGDRDAAAAAGSRRATTSVRITGEVARVRVSVERRWLGLRVPMHADAAAPLEPGARR